MTHEYFNLPSDMQEATPDDVRGVLDAIDVLLINATYTPEEVTLPGYEPKSDVHGVNAETLRHIAEKYMRRNRISPEQLVEIGREETTHKLTPVGNLDLFQVKRYPEFRVTLGIIIRRPLGGEIAAAHVHNYPDSRGLRIDFVNDVLGSDTEPKAQTATVADCEELVRQLGMATLLGD